MAGAESGASGAGSAVTTALRYDAFGQTIGTYPSTGSSLAVRYRGLVDLAPTADTDVAGAGSDPLYAMGARLYAPHLGAFTSFDTYAGEAQDPASMNRYLYAHANPATLIDPTGHKPIAWDGGTDDSPEAVEEAEEAASESIANGNDPGTTSTGPTDPSTGTPALTAGGAVPPDAGDVFLVPSVPGVGSDALRLGADELTRLQAWCYASNDQAVCAAWRAGVKRYEAGNPVDPPDGHLVLDVVGIADLFGVADGANAIWYASEGDVLNAAISVAGIAFLVGDTLKGGRVGAKIFGAATRGGDEITSLATRRGEGAIQCATHSFAATTLVRTVDGETPISEVDVGDEVTALDPASGRTDSYAVTATFIHDDPVTGMVEIDGEPIVTTPGHQFLTVERGWVEADALVPGEHVPSVSGGSGLVGEVRWEGGRATMYDLTVETVHTFAVGTGGWVVHHCGPFDGPNGDFILKTTKAADEPYPKKSTRIEGHHEHPLFLGGELKGPIARLPASYHQLITNEFRQLAPYGTASTRALTAADIAEIMAQVYRKYPLE